jgi:hypothetical protein
MQPMYPIRIRAVNTAAESENKIHDDRIAAQFGFRGGLVPGVTVYGYLAEAALQHFGEAWLDHGAMDVRFHQPVYDGEEVEVTFDLESKGRIRIDIAGRASGTAWMHDDPGPARIEVAPLADRRTPGVESLTPGVVLGSLEQKLDLAQARMSAPLSPVVGSKRFAHPAILIALANEIFVKNYALGPWIHSASEVRNHSAARDGEPIRVLAVVEDRFERKGHEFVVMDVLIESADGRPIEYVRHTAIWQPRVAR